MKTFFANKNISMIGILLIGAVLIVTAFFNPLAATVGLGMTAFGLIAAGNYAGPKPGWSSPIFSENPADLYGLTKAQAEKIAQFIGFMGKDVAQADHEFNVWIYDGTDAPTVTDFAVSPIGTVLVCPKLTKSRLYIHKAQSSPAVVGDWYYIEGTQVT